MSTKNTYELNKKKLFCSGCTACQFICPVSAILMKKDNEGFYYPHIIKDRCIECMLCEQRCPFKHFENMFKKSDKPTHVYAAKHKNLEVRKNSSSGGLFYAISKYVLKNKGYIVGAAFDDKFRVRHIIANTEIDLNRLRGSKYVQSEKREIFTEIKIILNRGDLVYFTGLPCEVVGLYAYLNKQYSNLITSDLICHGVPSPKIWADYLHSIQGNWGKEIDAVSFRKKKKHGGGNLHIHIQIGDMSYSRDSYTDSYYRLFFKNLILRPSCHACGFANVARCSDITMADFWGCKKAHPDFYDAHGVSMAIVNTEKGGEIFKNIHNHIDWVVSDLSKAIQPNLYHPSRSSTARENFWQDYNLFGYQFVQRKYVGTALWNRIKSQIIYPLLKKFRLLYLFGKT